MQDRCVSPALLFHSLQRRWVWLVQPFGLADVFSWPRNWGFGYLYFSFLSFLLFSSWHTRMPKAITVKYQPHLLDGSTTIAIVAAELQSDAPGFGSRAYPTQPTTSLRQTDALKMEECTQMGCCLSFRRPWCLLIDLWILCFFEANTIWQFEKTDPDMMANIKLLNTTFFVVCSDTNVSAISSFQRIYRPCCFAFRHGCLLPLSWHFVSVVVFTSVVDLLLSQWHCMSTTTIITYAGMSFQNEVDAGWLVSEMRHRAYEDYYIIYYI